MHVADPPPKKLQIAARLSSAAAVVAIVLTAVTAHPTSARATAAGPSVSHAEMVDSCTYESTSNWNKYFSAQPNVYGLGFYLGGTNASAQGCYIASASWVSGLSSNWGLIPIYDSLQSACEGGDQAFSSTNATAKSQGKSVADNAISKLADDGFTYSGNIVYLDLEAFSDSGNCLTAAKNFVEGWDEELNAGGYKAGLYGSSAGSHVDSFSSISNPPDDIWYANYNGDDTIAASDDPYISTSHWTHDQRIHQWDGNVSTSVGTDSSVLLDYDCMDATINGGLGPSTACKRPTT